jgi:CSLREA domain-containing protein
MFVPSPDAPARAHDDTRNSREDGGMPQRGVEMIRTAMEDKPGHRIRALGLLLAALVAARLMIAAKPAHADTFTVTNAADPRDGFCNAQGCTLREAIENANAAPDADIIDALQPE